MAEEEERAGGEGASSRGGRVPGPVASWTRRCRCVTEALGSLYVKKASKKASKQANPKKGKVEEQSNEGRSLQTRLLTFCFHLEVAAPSFSFALSTSPLRCVQRPCSWRRAQGPRRPLPWATAAAAAARRRTARRSLGCTNCSLRRRPREAPHRKRGRLQPTPTPRPPVAARQQQQQRRRSNSRLLLLLPQQTPPSPPRPLPTRRACSRSFEAMKA